MDRAGAFVAGASGFSCKHKSSILLYVRLTKVCEGKVLRQPVVLQALVSRAVHGWLLLGMQGLDALE